MPVGRKTATLNLRVDPALKTAAEKVAKAEHRTLTNLVEKLLADYVERYRRMKS